MPLQHPVYTLIFAIFLVAIIIKKCIIDHIFYKQKLILSFILVFLLAMLSLFYNEIKTSELWFNIMNYSLLGIDIIICLSFFFIGDNSLVETKFESEMIDIISLENYYLLLDKKLRIKKISYMLMQILNLDESCHNKKLNEVLDNNIKIISINDEAISNGACYRLLETKPESKNVHSLHIVFLKNDQTKGEIDLRITSQFIFNKYKGYILYGDFTLNKKIEQVASNDIISQRFSALLSLSQQGIFFKNLVDNSIWCNDFMVSSLKLLGNSMSLVDFSMLMDSSDYQVYQEKLKFLTPEDNKIEMIYRFKMENKLVFVKENSEVIFDGLKPIEVCGTLTVSYNKNFMKTNSSLVDNLKEELDLEIYINNLMQEEKVFELVYMSLSNIKEINERYSRSVGSMVIEEYVRTINSIFVDDDAFFRISGLDFVFVITDIRKMESFRKIITTKNILTPQLAYGSISLNLNVYMGISFSNEAMKSRDVYLNAKNAFIRAKEKNKNFLFYHDYNK